jgi:4'-phosphopantetheinyl transferase
MSIYQLNNASESIKIGVWKITETKDELLRELLSLGFDESILPQKKTEQGLKEWLSIRLLTATFFEKTHIAYDPLGKPFLDNGWHISISHANEFAAIILNKSNECGIDIEKISDKVSRIKHKFLNPLDLKTVTTPEQLTLYWGAKEALYKYYGKKEMLFIEHLFIEDFSPKKNTFKGRINMPDLKITVPMKYEIIENYILTYTL